MHGSRPVLVACCRRKAHDRRRLCHRLARWQSARLYCSDSIALEHALEDVPLFGLYEAELSPAEDVVGDRFGVTDLAAATPAAGFDAGVCDRPAEHSQWNAVL